MKSLFALIVLAGMAITMPGCSTPAYSTRERHQMWGRTTRFEWEQAQDDIDNVLLLRPPSRMTLWAVR
ncbi:MAG: hypothetical protein QOE14_2853 [Humisphaera sp.]|jgi:hypothetical protein|nr:hypothetical protein [Humisphaera sp.]